MSKASIIAAFTFAGAGLGLLYSLLVLFLPVLGMPGVLFAASFGYRLGCDAAAFPLCLMGNVCTYGLFGGLVGMAVAKFRQTRPNESPPECPLCGFRWAVPTHSTCPGCGHPRAFTAEAKPLPQCANCEYVLTGNISRVCPECGKPV